MKLKKGVPLIDQHDQFGFWGGKFGGSFIPETLKKPVEDLTKEFFKTSKHQKKHIDKFAAKIILDDFLKEYLNLNEKKNN